MNSGVKSGLENLFTDFFNIFRQMKVQRRACRRSAGVEGAVGAVGAHSSASGVSSVLPHPSALHAVIWKHYKSVSVQNHYVC